MILISSMNEEDQTSKCSVTSGNFLVEEKNTLSKLYKAKKILVKIINQHKMQFPVYKVVCQHGCRNGLTSSNTRCKHINENDISSLAREFSTHESSQKQPSELFKGLELWVDDVQFWAKCLLFDEKLHRHQPEWVRRHFSILAKKQLTHLVHKKMKKNAQIDLFKERAQQILLLCNNQEHESTRTELEYLFGKQLQF